MFTRISLQFISIVFGKPSTDSLHPPILSDQQDRCNCNCNCQTSQDHRQVVVRDSLMQVKRGQNWTWYVGQVYLCNYDNSFTWWDPVTIRFTPEEWCRSYFACTRLHHVFLYGYRFSVNMYLNWLTPHSHSVWWLF